MKVRKHIISRFKTHLAERELCGAMWFYETGEKPLIDIVFEGITLRVNEAEFEICKTYAPMLTPVAEPIKGLKQ